MGIFSSNLTLSNGKMRKSGGGLMDRVLKRAELPHPSKGSLGGTPGGRPQPSVSVERVFPMRGCRLATTLLLLSIVSGCSRPVKVDTFKSPTAEVFFTVETYDGGPGPLGSDVTKVYAHFERHGKSTRILVLEGDSLTVSKIIWNTPHEDIICLDGGSTDMFHNQVTLILGDSQGDSETIRNHLDEHCP